MSKDFKIYITEEFVSKYAKHSGDSNRLHTDRKYAAIRGFKAPIVHGMAIVALVVSKLIERGIVKSLKLSYKVRFIRPVEIMSKKFYLNVLCEDESESRLNVKVFTKQNLCSILYFQKSP
jgi:hypothetical protein